MCYDNVGIEEVSRHQGLKNKTVHVWTSAFAVKHRVLSRAEDPRPITSAREIPLSAFLPDPEDMDQRRERMVVVVQRILVAHLDHFSRCSPPGSVQHEHSDQLATKSDVVTIGVIMSNPGTREGTYQVLDHLHRFVPFPDDRNHNPRLVAVHGDGGSVGGMMSAKQARVASCTPTERLEGIWPVPGEFHRRILLDQDTINKLYVDASRSERGTLMNVKTVLQLKGMTKKVAESFNHVEDGLHITTKGLVCFVAMKLLSLSSPEDSLDDFSIADLVLQLEEISQMVVTFFWHQTPMNDIMETIECDSVTADELYCICNQPAGMLMYQRRKKNLVKCAIA